ncbi:MAG: ATP-binding protein [Bacteroidia bacterium]|nr:ATP-binding protein [Bacteroidia bacterium]
MEKELAISSSPENIRHVEALIDEVRDVLHFKDDVYGNVMVAMTEAVNNGIVHGNSSDISKKVFVKVSLINQYCLLITVEDEGPGFDPDALSDPTAPENIEKIGGRGVFLMQHLSDEITFSNEGRRVEMIFNI